MRLRVLVAAVAALAVGCGDATGPGVGSQVALQFGTSPGTAASPALTPLGLAGAGALSIALPGSNGTLQLDTIHVVVSEFELERADGFEGCDDVDSDMDSDGNDDCEEFDAGPLFLGLDLESGPTTVATALVPPGTYDEIEFEIEDLEDDDDDDGARIREIREAIQSQFPDWPREASMRVVGSFTPMGGEPQPFVAYFEAEVEIELEFETPFVVTDDEASRTITVELDPGAWFARSDGSVWNLALYDYESTGQVVEFEFEMEQGFGGVDHDDDWDDDSDD